MPVDAMTEARHQMSELTPEPGANPRSILFDGAIVLFATALMTLLSWRFELGEVFYSWTRRFENLQFDELPLILLVLTSGFIWFAYRRYREVGVAMQRQRAFDARLTTLLSENRQLARQNVEAQENERSSIARELHDEMGQYLNAIKIDAIALRDAMDVTSVSIREGAAGIARNADHVYGVIGDLIRRLRPTGLDEFGLIGALENCVDQWRSRLPRIRWSLAARGDFSRLSEAANLTLYRIVQEALTNVAKHAQAEQVEVTLSCSDVVPAEVTLRIVDDGRGMNLQSGHSGFGLINMRERVEMHGGTFSIATHPGRGFAIDVRLKE